jgi:hypothetical protein
MLLKSKIQNMLNQKERNQCNNTSVVIRIVVNSIIHILPFTIIVKNHTVDNSLKTHSIMTNYLKDQPKIEVVQE